MTEEIHFDEALGRIADANEVAAAASWIAAMEPAVAAEFGVRAERADGAMALFVPATGTAFFNRVLGLGVARSATRRLVRMLIKEYKRLDVAFVIHLAPYARPDDLGLWLAEEGLRRDINWLVMHRDPTLTPPRRRTSNFRIARAEKEDAEIFARTFCAGYGMPDEWAPLYRGFVGDERWRHLLAFDSGRAIATSSLFMNGRNFWAGNSATLPQYRKRGVHTMLNGERSRMACEMPCTAMTLETWRLIQNSV